MKTLPENLQKMSALDAYLWCETRVNLMNVGSKRADELRDLMDEFWEMLDPAEQKHLNNRDLHLAKRSTEKMHDILKKLEAHEQTKRRS